MKNSMLPEVLEQEQKVNEAFTKQSLNFDETDYKNPILQWMRSMVREHALSLWKPGERILELNAGTGIDAIYFAEKGFYIHATDNSPGMISVLEKKVKKHNLADKITAQKCSFLELEKVNEGKFDHIFSNFGGLNCTDKLGNVLTSASNLLRPDGTITLVIMPPVCPWEILFLLKGNFKLAFRRFRKGGTPSHLEGINFTTWYYSPYEVKKLLGKNYSIIGIKGIGITVPPPFLENYVKKHPGLFNKLITIENSIAIKAPFHAWADHFIISAKKLA
jgi:ubiquinone/menaquinone biosynthesis C-methylase UbiE